MSRLRINRYHRGFIVAGVLLILSLIFTILVKTVDVQPIGPAGTSVGFSRINKAFTDVFRINMVLYHITQVLGYAALLVVAFFGLGGAMQFIKRKKILKVDRELLAAGVLYVVVLGLYTFFEKVIINYRPVIMPDETAPEASFPSSHTLLACVVFISASILCETYVRSSRARKVTKTVFYILTAIMVIGRLFSGVHWLTDVLAGILYSSALLTAFITFVDLPEKRRIN